MDICLESSDNNMRICKFKYFKKYFDKFDKNIY